MQLTDAQLVTKILRGDPTGFQELVSRYQKPVFGICYRMMRQREEAEDLSQEVFIKAYRYLGQYNHEHKFSSWILKIATNTCIDAIRKKRVDTLPLDEEIKTNQEDVSAERAFLQEEAHREIEAAIGSLPPDYRIVVLLYHHQGQSYQQIADQLEIPMSMVKNRLFRARKMLKESLKKLKEETLWTAEQVQKS
ncbi:RNA polymerase sigma factor [Anoxynatronum buryatiense]|uniref:RNA polymerase sigma-70 factor, ECF subfamily n=1 Tax=Anoxynatronum buryatiense TaxID=489973 RepID=A0AA45WY32_9CLOT|nr:sigma-70 family RNA polymerase sigma factor [Anoxynatronum buryatiense]SMP67259.1 RNA polymerase sigma-70 factor, ECF subfamily [Anoxynatronum buryatiense]